MSIIILQQITDINSLPMEVLYKILGFCDVPDVISFSLAMSRPGLTAVLDMHQMWTSAVIGPRYLERSLQYLGEHTSNLTVIGSVQFDRNHKPRKERFFKSKELLPKSVINSVVKNCPKIKVLQLDKCVIGPHFNTLLFPQSLEILAVRSTIFVKKTSFFSNIWKNLKNLKELRVENIQNFNKHDCYAVLDSVNIDFNIKFGTEHHSPSFIFYKI